MNSLSVRLEAARRATQSAAQAIMALRGEVVVKDNQGDQLKTAVDQAAEAWVLGYLKSYFPDDRYLAEEQFEAEKTKWDAPKAYWTVDALDGTRSFVDGYDGFCVQVAYVENGVVQMGVVVEPVRSITYWAIKGQGAYRQEEGKKPLKLQLKKNAWPTHPVFVDSKPPKGAVGEFMENEKGKFLECGSIGLKICRVAEGAADVYAKDITFKLWDSAPGEIILNEAGGKIGLWSGQGIPCHGTEVYFNKILATPAAFFDRAVKNLERTGVKK